MIYSITVTNYLGDRIKIDLREPFRTGFLISSISGLGPSKANVNTTEVSTNDGAMFNSARVNQRNIVLEVIFIETQFENIEDIRQKTYKFFPIKKKVELLFETDNRKLKTIGYVESNEPNIFSSQSGTQISIICPDPYFYSNKKTTTGFYGVEPEFEFPFSNESLGDELVIFSSIQHKTENLIIYEGDSEIGIIIRIHAMGEAENITIYNTGTRETMSIDTDRLEILTGSGIIAGDDITINTQKERKSITLVREGKSTNILNCLEKGSDWFTLSKGDNIFAFTADTGTTNLQFWIENQIIYEGI